MFAAACTDAPYVQVKRAAEGVSSDCQHLGSSRTATVDECRRATCAARGNTFNIGENESKDNCYMKLCTGGTMPWTNAYGGYDVYTTLPCFNANGGCDHLCHDDGTANWCSCRSGFTLQSDLNTCKDYNECDNKPCNQTCTNTLGNYTCSCELGYELATDHHDCLDIDECDVTTDLCEHLCDNTHGSYTCKCKPGYSLDGKTRCTNADECTDGQHDCNQTCTDTVGSYTCSCTDGFIGNQDNKQCHDIDECISHPCAQTCANTPGSYSCSCRAGYSIAADGLQCHDFCTRQFIRTVSRASGVSSSCPTVKILENVTLEYSMHVACNLSSDVINVVDNVHVLKKCQMNQIKLSTEQGGWDVYNRFGPTDSDSDPTFPAWATGVVVAVVVVLIVVVVVVVVIAVLLKRRYSKTRGPPQKHTEQEKEESASPRTSMTPAGGTVRTLPDNSTPEQTTVGINPSGGVYEDIDQQRVSPSLTDTPGQTYYNIKPAESLENYERLDNNEIHPPMTNEYESMNM